MSLTIQSSTATSILSSIDGATTTQSTSSVPPPPPPPSDGSKISERGKLLSELKDLASSDPAKFKEVTQQISDQLKTEAQSATGDQAAALNKLSDKLAQASSSGDVSALAPPHHGHGGHKSGGYQATAANSGADAMKSAMDDALSMVEQALGTSSSSTTST